MKNKIEPETPLIDFKTVKKDVERKIRRRTRSSPSTSDVAEAVNQLSHDSDLQPKRKESSTYLTRHGHESQGLNINRTNNDRQSASFCDVVDFSRTAGQPNDLVKEGGRKPKNVSTMRKNTLKEREYHNKGSFKLQKFDRQQLENDEKLSHRTRRQRNARDEVKGDMDFQPLTFTLRDKASEKLSQLKSKMQLHNGGSSKNSDSEINDDNDTSSELRTKKIQTVVPSLFRMNTTKFAASKWKHFVATRRTKYNILKNFERLYLKQLCDSDEGQRNMLNDECFGFLEEDIDGNDGLKTDFSEDSQRIQTKSKDLIRYFVNLSKSKEEDKSIDLDYVEDLITGGADPNWGDKYGQTVLHEVARIWHTDVAQFLLDHGAKIDRVDKYGRSPLHVASAVDYSDMVEFLVSKGADIHARTLGEDQTPIHYAAKNDACNSLATLLNKGASIEDRDFKERTPLQLGAELDRSETCKILLHEGAPVGVWDDSGMSALSLMILKMPPVALQALDQFHIKDRANRKQYYYLNYLEAPMSSFKTKAKSSLKVAVEENQFSIIMHPVMQRLTEVKWNWFGKMGACFHFLTNLIFCIVWTVLICTLPNDVRKLHSPGSHEAYRIVLDVFVVAVLFYWILNEALEYRNSLRERDAFVRWREEELTRDIKYCHPRWPEERAYIEREIAELAEQKPSYFVDWWNLFDWFTYAFIVATMICHIVTVVAQSERAFYAEKSTGSLMLILQWTRLLKFVRAFQPLGPFVVILRHVISDTARFAFLFFIFYIPYAAALWVLFGKRAVNGYKNFGELCYNLLQISVVGDFGFSDLSSTDGAMARFLCGSYIIVSGIVCLNLFIALLSDTFQRVYDNVKANAQMLRASRVLNFEDNFSKKRRERYQRRIQKRCAPEISYYDDDMTDASDTELKRMTHQIKQDVDEMKTFLDERLGPHEGDALDNINHDHYHRQGHSDREEIEQVREEINLLRSNYDHSMKIVNMQLLSINSMLSEYVNRRKKKRGSRDMGTLSTGNGSQIDKSKVVVVAPISFDRDDSQA